MRLISPDSLSVAVLESCTTLGKMVVTVRKAHGLSQTALCNHANIARNTLSEIERGSPRVQFAHWLVVLDSLGLLQGMVSGISAAAGAQLADIAPAPRRRRT